MAEISLGKGSGAVEGVASSRGKPGALARPQVPLAGDERRRRRPPRDKEAEEEAGCVVILGEGEPEPEEREAQPESAGSETIKPEGKDPGEKGGPIIDVLV